MPSKKIKKFGPRSFMDASRYAVLQSDGIERVPCVNCGVMMTVFQYEAGHDIAENQGGKNTPDNHFPICGKEFNACNQKQGQKSGIEFLGATKYERVLKARELPYNNELVTKWHSLYLAHSSTYFTRHASKAEKATRA